jgi:acid phosphatase
MLTPGDTCLRYVEDKSSGRDQGYYKLALCKTNLRNTADRLSSESGGFTFSNLDIYSVMEICGFEILVRGDSPWCKEFTREE